MPVSLTANREQVFYCDGSAAEKDFLTKEALRMGVLIELNQQKLPGCYLHRSIRMTSRCVEQFTFICTPTKDEAWPDQ